MILGIDFDNTIVCYDDIFYRVALERKLIPESLPISKNAVRDHLRATGRGDSWTEMQGCVYGARMNDVRPFPGIDEFFRSARERGLQVRIISQRTRQPYQGPVFDLHEAAQDWMQANGAYDPTRWGLSQAHVFLELTRAAKLRRIRSCRCTHFIEDLPDLLADPDFPVETRPILFDPAGQHAAETTFPCLKSWREIGALLAALG